MPEAHEDPQEPTVDPVSLFIPAKRAGAKVSAAPVADGNERPLGALDPGTATQGSGGPSRRNALLWTGGAVVATTLAVLLSLHLAGAADGVEARPTPTPTPTPTRTPTPPPVTGAVGIGTPAPTSGASPDASTAVGPSAHATRRVETPPAPTGSPSAVPPPSGSGQSSTPPSLTVQAVTPTPPSGSPQVSTHTLTVAALSSSAVGVNVQAGQVIVVTAYGTAVSGYEGAADCVGKTQVDPDGNRSVVGGAACTRKYSATTTLPSAPVGALLARIGAGPWVFIGHHASLTATTTGSLSFTFNDSDRSDNSGAYALTYTITHG